MQPAFDHFCKRPDWHLAASTHLVQQSALARGGRTSSMIVQKNNVLVHPGVALANLDRERTLPCSRTHQLGRQHLLNGLSLAQSIETSSSQNDGIVLAGLEFPQPRVHIAA